VSIEEEETMNTERYLRGEKQTQRLTGELADMPLRNLPKPIDTMVRAVLEQNAIPSNGEDSAVNEQIVEMIVPTVFVGSCA
jgi:hypothetical protein